MTFIYIILSYVHCMSKIIRESNDSFFCLENLEAIKRLNNPTKEIHSGCYYIEGRIEHKLNRK